MKQCDKCINFKCICTSSIYDHEKGKSRPVQVGVCTDGLSPYSDQLISGENLCREFSQESERVVKVFKA